MKKTRSIILLLSLLPFLFACEPKDDELTNVEGNSRLSVTKDQQRFDDAEKKISEGKNDSDPFNINSVHTEGTILHVGVSYSGGCKEHSFEIIWPEAILMIYPPNITVILNHDANGDNCDAHITETLKFDLEKSNLGLNAETIEIMTLKVQNGSNPEQVISK